jgi:hypothetical protein
MHQGVIRALVHIVSELLVCPMMFYLSLRKCMELLSPARDFDYYIVIVVIYN